jgi:hypothetical protein
VTLTADRSADRRDVAREKSVPVSQIARVTLRYTGARAKVIGVELIEGPVPISYLAPSRSSTGVWIAVTDPRGLEVFHQPLPDPFAGGEVPDRDGKMRRMKSNARHRYATWRLLGPVPVPRLLSMRAAAFLKAPSRQKRLPEE